MSGGAYALLGMQLGDVILNWERKSAPYRRPKPILDEIGPGLILFPPPYTVDVDRTRIDARYVIVMQLSGGRTLNEGLQLGRTCR